MIRTYLEHLTMDELTARLAQIEAMGKATRARLDANEQSETVTYAIRKGDRVDVSKLQYALNGQRSAWKQTKLEITRRNAAQ